MSIFSAFTEPRLRETWRYSCPGVLWRILFSPNGVLVGEIRNPEMQRTTFFCMEERSGRILWENRGLPEPWWVGIEDVLDQVILFHSYAKPDMPQHRGVIAWDIRHGELLWERPHDMFQFAHDGLVYAAQEGFEQRRYFALDAFSGEVRRDFGADSSEINALRGNMDREAAFKDYSYPARVPDAAAAIRETGIAELPRLTGGALTGAVDLLSFPPYAIVSWHEKGKKEEEGLLQRLAIFEKESGRELYSETLQEKIPFPGEDSFFMKGEMLFFVKDMAILAAIRLGKE